jgi:cytochrome P450
MRKTTSSSPFAQASFRADPYALFAQLRDEGPVRQTRLPNGKTVYLVTRYTDVEAGLKDNRLVKNIRNVRRRGLLDVLGFGGLRNNNMLRADPPAHTRLRGLASEAFKPKYIRELRRHIQRIADDLLDKVQPRGGMDLIADFSFPLPVTVIGEMLGVPASDHDKFRRWSTGLITSGALSSDRPRLGPDVLRLVKYVRRLVADHRRHPRNDVITQLIEADHDGDHLSGRELVSTIVLLLIAGHETTVNLIGNGMLALLQHPDELAQLQRNPARIKQAVEEILRYVNPVQLVNRYAAEAMVVGGVPVPRGAHVQLLLASANRDPAYVAAPEALTVANDEAKHVAFGQGVHYCLGAPLARVEGEIAFTTLLSRLPHLRLAVRPNALEWRPALELRGLVSLPVTF